MRRILIVLALALAVAAPFLLAGQSYYSGLLAYAAVLAIFGLSINLTVGYLGLISFGHAAFFGLGAYVAGLAIVNFGVNYWVTLLFAPIPAALLGALVGFASVRLGGAYFAIATLTTAEILRLVVSNWIDLTRGPLGLIVRRPRVEAFESLGLVFHQYYLLATLLGLGLAVLIVHRLLESPTGRSWKVIRESNALAESIGIPTMRQRVMAIALSGGLAGFAGVLFIPRTLVLTPDLFNPMLSATGLLIAILGGKGTLIGPLLGGAIFAALPETLRFVDEYRIAIFALILLAVIRIQPAGLAPLFHLTRPFRTPGAPAKGGEIAFEPSPRLVVTDLTKRFGGLTAVDNVSMTIEPGELVGIIGPNGAGKTTCLSLISGFTPPTAGEIRYGERKVTGDSPSSLVNEGLARTFQQAALCGSQTVFENVLAATSCPEPASLLSSVLRGPGWRAREARRVRRAWECLAFVGLTERAALEAGSLPYGEQKMLAIAVSLATQPRLLMLDEPAAGLNHTEANRLADLLRSLRQRGLTIVLVDHNLRMMMALCDRIIVLDRGRLIAQGTPAEIQADKAVIAAYLGGYTAEEAQNA
ncbi:branched-chain amino acid ABC transporter ATP-binding protein/permease [Chelatococcus asaccharovorans]|uniref:branched-chain amino acid ABC transporter ATP-binding protein/permease n=1 Tax=Chelatococcus asaccharovorans TaxID=28210 RepID=UPI00224C6B5C|nr:branched-chain amino acid ABC transporter ATP-binding protein/permease [Chelatococcus asaccharovorans]CAH1661460.1 Branched-chain amino acid transport system permease protein [Chelatococcus asaccharovorans]CAH1683465.1 Branched-chain amino acid transport system permease protein [Chelatococcus asaccharovorans]